MDGKVDGEAPAGPRSQSRDPAELSLDPPVVGEVRPRLDACNVAIGRSARVLPLRKVRQLAHRKTNRGGPIRAGVLQHGHRTTLSVGQRSDAIDLLNEARRWAGVARMAADRLGGMGIEGRDA